jgi:hypothetical protein
LATDYSVIFQDRHPELKKKDDNWTLIYNAYLGGTYFSDGGYLTKYPKESQKSFEIRKSRAVYFNQVSPIVDMISGLLYLNLPTRKIPDSVNYLLENVGSDKKIDEFMRIVSAHAFMFTCGILIDSPDFDPEKIRTEKDRRDNKINPYGVLYLPFRIRDFNININDGQLDWVILDNSYSDHTDPFKPRVEIVRYTLWTRTGHQDFEMTDAGNGQKIVTPVTPNEIPHNVGYVPFRFVSWRDDNADFVSETVCEDIAMVSKLIYNNMSYMDEMLASGTFKMLAYPTKDGTAPEELIQGGVGALSILPYSMESSTQPGFIGASLDDIDPFVKAIEFYMAEVLKKVGLSTDETKEFVKSGAAKKIDFQKMKALLVTGALMMSKTEEWIFRTAAAWQGIYDLKDLKIEYTAAYSDEDLRTEVTMLTELLVHPVKKLRKNVLDILVKKLLANYLSPDILEDINKDIEASITADPEQGKSDSKIDVVAEAARLKNKKETEQGDKKDD